MTAAVIQFLTRPGSDFGTQPTDIDALRSVAALAGELRFRLETLPPESDIATKAIDTTVTKEAIEYQQLQQCLREGDWHSVDWLRVMEELRIRLRLTDGFFAQDLPLPKNSA